MSQALVWCSVVFLSTPSARRATGLLEALPTIIEFLSTPSARRATYVVYIVSRAKNFYPRPPRGGRPVHSPSRGSVVVFLSTPSARRATFEPTSERYIPSNYFYPRPPRGGRPCGPPGRTARIHHFYPRPPRGGRLECIGPRHGAKKISIHALREEGDGRHLRRVIVGADISIHALREEGDACGPCRIC